MRYYAATCALGIDHAFKEQELVRGGRLATKTWNVMKMVGSACPAKPVQPLSMHPIDSWVMSRFARLVKTVEETSDEYRFDQSMAALENFMWHEFADHYVELVKHRAYSELDGGAKYALYTVGLGLLKMMSVFLPHMAEDAYQSEFRKDGDAISIHVSGWPEAPLVDEDSERRGEAVKAIVAEVRSWKSAKGLSLNSPVSRLEIVGAEARDLVSGSEEDISGVLRTGRLEIRDRVELKEAILGVKPIHAKLGPMFKKDAKAVVERMRSARPDELRITETGLVIRMDDGRDLLIPPECYEVVRSLTSDRGELQQRSAAGLSLLIYQ